MFVISKKPEKTSKTYGDWRPHNTRDVSANILARMQLSLEKHVDHVYADNRNNDISLYRLQEESC